MDVLAREMQAIFDKKNNLDVARLIAEYGHTRDCLKFLAKGVSKLQTQETQETQAWCIIAHRSQHPHSATCYALTLLNRYDGTRCTWALNVDEVWDFVNISATGGYGVTDMELMAQLFACGYSEVEVELQRQQLEADSLQQLRTWYENREQKQEHREEEEEEGKEEYDETEVVELMLDKAASVTLTLGRSAPYYGDIKVHCNAGRDIIQDMEVTSEGNMVLQMHGSVAAMMSCAGNNGNVLGLDTKVVPSPVRVKLGLLLGNSGARARKLEEYHRHVQDQLSCLLPTVLSVTICTFLERARLPVSLSVLAQPRQNSDLPHGVLWVSKGSTRPFQCNVQCTIAWDTSAPLNAGDRVLVGLRSSMHHGGTLDWRILPNDASQRCDVILAGETGPWMCEGPCNLSSIQLEIGAPPRNTSLQFHHALQRFVDVACNCATCRKRRR